MQKTIRNFLVNLARFLNKANNQRGAILGGFIAIISSLLFLFFIRTPRHGEIISIKSTTHPRMSTTLAISPTKWWIKATPTFTSSRLKDTTPLHQENISEYNCMRPISSSLQPGIFAYISLTPPLPNRIRSGAGQEYSYIGQIEPGNGIEILDGPVCADSFVWWLVKSVTGELRGWTPEGRNSEKWIIPCPNEAVACDKTPQPTPTLAVAKSDNKAKDDMCWSEKLAIGTSAQVDQGNLLVIRSEPNNGEVVGRAGPLSVLHIVGGPTCLDGTAWWRVKIVKSNLSGWATESNIHICSKEDTCN